MEENNKNNEITVLVVDDDQTFVKFISKFIEVVFGHKTHFANNPVEAFKMLGKKEFDLLILDLEMPVMDGFEMLTKIRNNEGLKDLRVIICTAIINDMLLNRLAKLNIDSYILKPAEKKTYVEKLKYSFDKIKSNSENAD